jgi:D-alanine transaminase
MTAIVYLNGEFVPRERARVSVDDRGFLFGDGVYEVTRAFRGRLFEAARHLGRLERGLEALRIEPGVSAAQLLDISERLVRDNGLDGAEATVYLQVTRGAAPRTHHFPPRGTPATVYLAAAPYQPPSELRARGAAAITHPDVRWARCDLKSVNLLPNTLAKQRAVEAGAAEAIFVRDGVVTEGANTTVFGALAGVVRTYPLTNYILPGVTRAVLLELAAELGIMVRETPLLAEELSGLDELFVASTTTDVLPVVRLDGRPVGDGRVGPIARALYDALAARVAGAGAAVGAAADEAPAAAGR